MKRIIKGIEPASLTVFKSSFPNLKYINLSPGHEHVRIDIRRSCLEDQYYLCAYCSDRIELNSCHNEHIIPQGSLNGENLTLEYSNIVASCQSKNHCGHKKDKQIINLSPLDRNCENNIVYQLNGKMTHVTPAAQQTINVLNLRNSGLVYKRKSVIDLVLFTYVDDLIDLDIENKEYLEDVINELSQPDANGKLEAFSPIIINVIKNFI